MEIASIFGWGTLFVGLVVATILGTIQVVRDKDEMGWFLLSAPILLFSYSLIFGVLYLINFG